MTNADEVVLSETETLTFQGFGKRREFNLLTAPKWIRWVIFFIFRMLCKVEVSETVRHYRSGSKLLH